MARTCSGLDDAVEAAVAALRKRAATNSTPAFTWIDLVADAPARASDAEQCAEPVPAGLSKMAAQFLATAAANKRARLNEETRATEAADVRSALTRVDEALQRIFAAAPAGSTVIAVTQGDLSAMRHLSSQKMRNRWEYASLKKRLHLADCSRASWEMGVDENRLAVAAAHAIAGSVFVRRKDQK